MSLSNVEATQVGPIYPVSYTFSSSEQNSDITSSPVNSLSSIQSNPAKGASLSNNGIRAFVLYDFRAASARELAVFSGEIVEFLGYDSAHKWAYVDVRNSRGYVPVSYITLVDSFDSCQNIGKFLQDSSFPPNVRTQSGHVDDYSDLLSSENSDDVFTPKEPELAINSPPKPLLNLQPDFIHELEIPLDLSKEKFPPSTAASSGISSRKLMLNRLAASAGQSAVSACQRKVKLFKQKVEQERLMSGSFTFNPDDIPVTNDLLPENTAFLEKSQTDSLILSKSSPDTTLNTPTKQSFLNNLPGQSLSKKLSGELSMNAPVFSSTQTSQSSLQVVAPFRHTSQSNALSSPQIGVNASKTVPERNKNEFVRSSPGFLQKKKMPFNPEGEIYASESSTKASNTPSEINKIDPHSADSDCAYTIRREVRDLSPSSRNPKSENPIHIQAISHSEVFI